MATDRNNDSAKELILFSNDAVVNTYNAQNNLRTTNRGNELTIASAYHLSEINQNEDIIKTAKRIIWAGFGLIAFGVIFTLFGKAEVTLITSISGLITEIISGVVFAFVTQSSKSKLQYFNQLSLDEEGNKLIQVIETLDKDAKEKLLEKLVESYCERRK